MPTEKGLAGSWPSASLGDWVAFRPFLGFGQLLSMVTTRENTVEPMIDIPRNTRERRVWQCPVGNIPVEVFRIPYSFNFHPLLASLLWLVLLGTKGRKNKESRDSKQQR